LNNHKSNKIYFISFYILKSQIATGVYLIDFKVLISK